MLEKCCPEFFLSHFFPQELLIDGENWCPRLSQRAIPKQAKIFDFSLSTASAWAEPQQMKRLWSSEICLGAQCLQHPCPSWEQTVLCCGDDDDACVEHVLHLVLLRRHGRKVNICF